ncbi:Alpha-glucoside transport system permease protein AglF [Halomicronema hongdechloris C2206]|uniref:Alpha-glucoside transport system permease protein AglF n=1 Tax=Halomicronema hongdechloris C2206 TaxID=1641165 RepID=A0A1Z3HLC1_9CYAN|nr:sugar ABC transporter permease [Halomicronema hongdechloris]ASC71088.1 Alpha-glucoside transport system permease protein AglF [Halomicronema hongdechloris C2206]
MQDSSNLMRLLGAIAAIVLGSGGVIALFYGANLLANRLPFKLRHRILPWVYMVPALAVLGAFLILPTLRTIVISFMDRRSQQFVGFDNYLFAFTNTDMLIAFRNNILWLVLVTGVSVSLGLVIAVLVDRVPYEPLAKALIFLPMAISFVGASVIWRFMYAYQPPGVAQIGLLNAIVVALGFEPIGWLVNKAVNNFALIAIMIWLQTGFAMVLLSSAVKGIPRDVIEAARIDGANEFQIFWRITIPMISSTIVVVSTTIIVLVGVEGLPTSSFVMTGRQLGHRSVIASRMIKEMFNFPQLRHAVAIARDLAVAGMSGAWVANIRRFQPAGRPPMTAGPETPATPAPTRSSAPGEVPLHHLRCTSWWWAIAVIWTLPTAGLLISSFRQAESPDPQRLGSGISTSPGSGPVSPG